MSLEACQAFARRYQELKQLDGRRDELVHELLFRLKAVSEDLEQAELDRDREKEFNRQLQRLDKKHSEDLRQLRSEMARDPFVLTLIDGDGVIFRDEHLQQGEAGGKQAAAMLHKGIRDYILSMYTDLPADCRIIVRIYANLRGLAQTCRRNRSVADPEVIVDFMRGFTGGRQLFDFIDVGAGKDRADEKISELFKLYLNNIQCRHIILGGSHDNGYARLLEEIIHEPHQEKVILIESVPFERELASLASRFGQARFDELFRTTKIVNNGTATMAWRGPLEKEPGSENVINQRSLVTPSLPQPSTTEPQTLPTSTTKDGHAAIKSPWKTVERDASSGQRTSSDGDNAASEQPSSQASGEVRRNKAGQRIDPPFRNFAREDVHRVRGYKMCNVHYLRPDWHNDEYCKHTHDLKPSPYDLAILKNLARTTPCNQGSQCGDAKCIYGHHCPYSEPGSRSCFLNQACRFEPSQHGIDTQAVHTIRV